jgi:hypothetical protein
MNRTVLISGTVESAIFSAGDMKHSKNDSKNSHQADRDKNIIDEFIVEDHYRPHS